MDNWVDSWRIGGGFVDAWNWLSGLFSGSHGDSSTAYDPTNSKQVYAESLNNVTSTYLANQHTNAANCFELSKAANYFFDRKAETAAKSLYDNQTRLGQSHTYDRNYVLDNGGISVNATAYVYQIVANYNSIFNGYATLGGNFAGTYEGMSWGVTTTDGSAAGSTITGYEDTSFIAGYLINTDAGQHESWSDFHLSITISQVDTIIKQRILYTVGLGFFITD